MQTLTSPSKPHGFGLSTWSLVRFEVDKGRGRQRLAAAELFT